MNVKKLVRYKLLLILYSILQFYVVEHIVVGRQLFRTLNRQSAICFALGATDLAWSG